MGFTVFRTVMTILICCFLLLLFVLPSAYLKAFSEDAEALLYQHVVFREDHGKRDQ